MSNQTSEAAETFSVSLTKAQLEFLLFTIGYMKAESEHCADTERFYYQEHLKTIFPKVLGAQKAGHINAALDVAARNLTKQKAASIILSDMGRSVETLVPCDEKTNLRNLLDDLYELLEGPKSSSD